MSDYFKSKYLAEPVIYVQDEDDWRSYGLGGRITKSAGIIPPNLLAGLEPLGRLDAEELIDRRLAEAHETEAEFGGAGSAHVPDRPIGRIAGPRRNRPALPSSVAAQKMCDVTVSASADEVKAAARGWARDVGWPRPSEEVDSLLFRLPFWVSMNPPSVEVRVRESSTGTRVQFIATLVSIYPGMKGELAPVAEAFAHGVCRELASAGAVIWPPSLADLRQDRLRIRRIEQLRKYCVWAIPAALIAVVLLGIAGVDGMLVATAAVWVAVLWLAHNVLRLRLIGMNLGLQIAVVGALLVGPAFAFTVAAAYLS